MRARQLGVGTTVVTLREETGLRSAYAAHGGELYRFARRALEDEHAAQDAVQETFLRAWRAGDRYDPELSSLRVWLFAIARNVVIDQSRSRAARPWLGELAAPEAFLTAPSDGPDPVELLLRRWTVEEAVGRLGDDHRTAIVETYLRGRPYSEVAAELGIPVATLRSRVFYALKALRVAMDEMGVTP